MGARGLPQQLAEACAFAPELKAEQGGRWEASSRQTVFSHVPARGPKQGRWQVGQQGDTAWSEKSVLGLVWSWLQPDIGAIHRHSLARGWPACPHKSPGRLARAQGKGAQGLPYGMEVTDRGELSQGRRGEAGQQERQPRGGPQLPHH